MWCQIWQRYFETETNLLKRAFFNFEWKRMSRYERAVCNRFDLVFTVSEHDKAVLQDELDVKCPIEVLESGAPFASKRNFSACQRLFNSAPIFLKP